MPYITQRQRQELDPAISTLVELLKEASVETLDGELNYTITRLAKALYPPKYFNYNRIMGVLNCVTHELYRTQIGPYEELKRLSEGDVS